MLSVYLIVFIISGSIINLDAKILEGYLSTTENWAFLARFCFLSERGKFKYDFIISNKNTEANLLLYYDHPLQWEAVYPSNKTCLERESVLDRSRGQIVSLSPYTTYTEVSGCAFTSDEQTTVRCNSYREFISARPRWWYIALADCNSKEGLNVSYWISLTNSDSNFFRQHFSADEFYILPELMIAVCLYVLLIGFSIYVAFELKSRRLLHETYKLFMLSLMAQLMGLLLEIHSSVNRAFTGRDLTWAILIGNILEAISETVFTTLLILMSLGYTVTKSILTPVQRARITAFIGLTIFLQISLFVYESEAFDPGIVLYLYESPPGYSLLVLKLLAWIVFVICCYKTSQNYSTKFHFYGSLLSLGSSWFLCQPLVVLTITFAVDKWIRESVEKGLNLWVIFIGHITFLFVTRPSSANTNFPFHIRTCQIAPINEGQGHSYEPRGRTAMTLFTLSHSPPPQYNSNITE